MNLILAISLSMVLLMIGCTKKDSPSETVADANQSQPVEKVSQVSTDTLIPEKIQTIKAPESPIFELTFGNFYSQFFDSGWSCICDTKEASKVYPYASLILKNGIGKIDQVSHLIVSYHTNKSLKTVAESSYLPLSDGEKPFVAETKIKHEKFESLSLAASWPGKKNLSTVVINGGLAIAKFELVTHSREANLEELTFLGRTAASVTIQKK